jgi:DNA repair protein RadC
METKDLLNQSVAEIEIHYKTKVKPSERKKISQSSDCAEIFMKIFDYNTIEYREYFYAMYLNRANKILAVMQISAGGISGTVADGKMIFQGALKLNATCIVVCHNHPSGNLLPSEADIKLTQKLKEGARVLDMQLLDSLIINSEGKYTSLADEGHI